MVKKGSGLNFLNVGDGGEYLDFRDTSRLFPPLEKKPVVVPISELPKLTYLNRSIREATQNSFTAKWAQHPTMTPTDMNFVTSQLPKNLVDIITAPTVNKAKSTCGPPAKKAKITPSNKTDVLQTLNKLENEENLNDNNEEDEQEAPTLIETDYDDEDYESVDLYNDEDDDFDERIFSYDDV